MKKALAIVIALVLSLSLASVAFAASATNQGAVTLGVSGGSPIAAGTTTTTTLEPGGKLTYTILAGGNTFGSVSSFEDQFRASTSIKKGEVKSVEIKKNDAGVVVAEIKLVSTYDVDSFDYELTLKFVEKFDSTVSEFKFTQDDVEYTAEDASEYMTLTPDTTVIDFDVSDFADTRTEFEFTADVFDLSWKGVEGDKLYFGYDTDVDTDLLDEYEDIDFESLNFQGKPELSGTATVTFYTDDDKAFLYEENDGVWTLVDTEYDSKLGGFEFTTRTLGYYIATTEELPAEATEAPAESGDEGGKDNPDTGVNGFVNVAVVAAVVSLAAAGAVALKK